ncbi:hypothetical protein RJ639_018503, partial [Escallonia herrerae]
SGPLAAYYKLPLNRVLVFHDDMDLPCGVLRLHDKGGHASHNGYVLEMLCTWFHNYEAKECDISLSWEQRVSSLKNWYWEASWSNGSQGILAPKVQCNSSTTGRSCLRTLFYSIIRFIPAEIDAALQEGAGVLKQLILKGLTESARCFNREQKYKHIRLQTMPT